MAIKDIQGISRSALSQWFASEPPEADSWCAISQVSGRLAWDGDSIGSDGSDFMVKIENLYSFLVREIWFPLSAR